MKIVLSALLAMFLVACSNENKQTTEAPAEAVKSETTQVEQPKAAPETLQEAPVTKAPEVAQPEEKKVEEVKKVEAVPTKPEPVTEAPKEVAAASSKIDGGKLFTKCAACHGANAEKPALNKSKIIKGWSVEEVMNALHGYKDGTYGSSMKGVMKSQISNYSEAELKALAEHISKL
jgi:cytochrome c553